MKKIKGPSYWKADQNIHDFVYRILQKHRPEIEHFNSNIIVIWKDVAEASGGKMTLAKIGKVSERDKAIYETLADFILQISSNTWQTLKEDQREAIIYHELLHIDINAKDGTFILRKHDVEEFSNVVEHYGFYKSDVQEFAQTILNVDIGKISEKKSVKRYKLQR